jgi:hypothetical protein
MNPLGSTGFFVSGHLFQADHVERRDQPFEGVEASSADLCPFWALYEHATAVSLYRRADD